MSTWQIIWDAIASDFTDLDTARATRVGVRLLMAALFRISSLSALVGATLAPIYVWLFGYGPMAIITFGLLAVLMYWRHRSNIGRIAAGTEPKIGQKKAATATPPPDPPP